MKELRVGPYSVGIDNRFDRNSDIQFADLENNVEKT